MRSALKAASFSTFCKKLKDQKTQNSRKKLNNSRKKLKIWANFKDFVLIRLNFSNKHPSGNK